MGPETKVRHFLIIDCTFLTLSSIYNGDSKVLLLWGQEDPSERLREDFQPPFFRVRYYSLIECSEYLRDVLSHKETRMINDDYDRVVFDPDYTYNRKKFIDEPVIYILGLLHSDFARNSESYNEYAIQLSASDIWDGLSVLVRYLNTGEIRIAPDIENEETGEMETNPLNKCAILTARFLEVVDEKYLGALEKKTGL